jgi:hypothetical protein
MAWPKRRILGHKTQKLLKAGVSCILMISVICTLHRIIPYSGDQMKEGAMRRECGMLGTDVNCIYNFKLNT